MALRDQPSLRAAEALLVAGQVGAAERMLLSLTRRPAEAGRAFLQLARLSLCGNPPRPAAAWRRVQRAMAAGLDAAPVHHLAGACHELRGDHEAAARHYAMATARNPADPELHSALGNALRRLGRLDESLSAHRRALDRGAQRATVWSNYAVYLRERGDHDASLDAFARAVALRPDSAVLRHNLGNAKLRIAVDDVGLEDAIDALGDALALDPNGATGQAARVDMATALRRLARDAEAFELLTQSVDRHPEDPAARYNLGLAHLTRADPQRGDWAVGWSLYEARRELPGFPVRRVSVTDWDGASRTDGHLCLTAEQGLGDTVQFARFVVPAAARFGGAVTLVVPDRLRPLLSSLCERAPRLRVVGEVSRDDVLRDASHHLPLMSLVHVLGLGPAELPGREGFLVADPLRRPRWSAWLDDLTETSALRVGIAWQGNPSYVADADRSVPLEHFARLAAVPGVELVSLQQGFGQAQLELPQSPQAHQPPAEIDRDGAFLDSAALISALDLVVSSDTALLHVAASVGAEVWCPLAARCDWRWGRHAETSPWYRRLTLIRQSTPGDWAGVFERLAVAVAQRASEKTCKYVSTSAQAS